MRLLILLMLCMAFHLSSAEAAPATRYWLAPSPGAPGVLELFTEPDAWTQSRSLVQVLQLFGGSILSDDAYCESCDDVSLPNLVARDAFSQLRAWGMKFSLEVGAIKGGTPDRCDGTGLASEGVRIVQRLHDAGARVDYFAMDNPSMSALLECGESDDQLAANMARYTSTVENEFARLYPGEAPLKFLLVDGYAGLGFSADRMIQLTDLMLAHGARIDGFHPDLDLRAVRGAKIGDTRLRSEIQKLMSYTKAHGMEFGLLLTGMNGGSDQAYHDETLQWVRKYRWLLGSPTYDGVLESWEFFKNPDGSVRWVPTVLPETGPETHTKLLLDIDGTMKRNVTWFEVLFDGFWVPW